MKVKNEELQRKRIADAKKTIAKSLGRLEQTANELRWACEASDWNDDVAFLVEEANLKLGYALATLETWFDDEEQETEGEGNNDRAF